MKDMKKEKRILNALGKVSEKYIEEAAPIGRVDGIHIHFWVCHRVAACICAVLLTCAVCFGTAYAVSPTFRETVISVFFPVYTNEEIHDIAEGHRTGSFDVDDTLLTFLDKFNNEKMEAGISAEKNGGYRYILLAKQSDVVKAVVDCDQPDYKLLVTMNLKPQEDTAGLWQAVSYQVIGKAEAERLKSDMPFYQSPENAGPTSPSANERAGGEWNAVAYNANGKNRVIAPTAGESRQLKGIFDQYAQSSEVNGEGAYPVVIRFQDTSYMLSSDGNVIADQKWNVISNCSFRR